jgi:hypothetical protein
MSEQAPVITNPEPMPPQPPVVAENPQLVPYQFLPRDARVGGVAILGMN